MFSSRSFRFSDFHEILFKDHKSHSAFVVFSLCYIQYSIYCYCLVPKSCPSLCDPSDGSLPGPSVCRISQARILERAVISFSRGPSWPRARTWVLCIGRKIRYCWANTEALYYISYYYIYISVHKFWIFSRLKLQTSLFFSFFRVPRFRGLPFLPTSFLLSFLLWGVLWGCRLQSSHVSKTPPLKGQGPCCWRSLFFWV